MAKPVIPLLTFLGIALTFAVNAQSPDTRLSADEARKLVSAAIDPNRSKAVLEPMHNPYEPDFLFFEAIDPDPDHSAHMGTFAVNSWTGDVWDTAGFCRRVTSSRLIKMLERIRAHSSLTAAEFARRHASKPICDAA
jgi:hypothetical protein